MRALRPNRFGSIVLALAFLQACQAYKARHQETSFYEDIALKNEAWVQARVRLRAMCPSPPTGVEEYRRGVVLRETGADPFQDCDFRLYKLTNSPQTDDWDLLWFPSYATIVQVHEEELRKRAGLKIYEEYMLAIARYLAAKTDGSDLTPQAQRVLFNYGWTWMINKTNEEAILLRDSTLRAEQLDAQAWQALAKIGQGLAIGVGAAAVAYANQQRTAYGTQTTLKLAPIHCTANRYFNTVHVDCY